MHEKQRRGHGRGRRDEAESRRGSPWRFRRRCDEFDGVVDGGGADLGEVELELGFRVSSGAEWRLGLVGGLGCGCGSL